MNTFCKAFALGNPQKAPVVIEKTNGPVKVFELAEEEESINSSITSECIPNHSINDSISFKNLYFSEGRMHSEKTYPKPNQKILRLKEKVRQTREELQQSKAEISLLKRKIEENYKLHASQLQNMQEKHEIKLKKTKRDIDFLLNDLNSKSTAILAQTFFQKHSEDLEALHKYYLNHIQNIKAEYERKLRSKKTEQKQFTRVLKCKINRIWDKKKNGKSLGGPSEVQEILDLLEENKENDSFEEMSTVESECIEKKSFSAPKLKKKASFFTELI